MVILKKKLLKNPSFSCTVKTGLEHHGVISEISCFDPLDILSQYLYFDFEQKRGVLYFAYTGAISQFLR